MSRLFIVVIAASAVLAAIIVSMNLRRGDSGAMVVDGCTVKPYPGALVLQVHESQADQREVFSAALRAWSAGGPLLGVAVPAGREAVQTFAHALEGTGPEPVGYVLVISAEDGASLLRDWQETSGHARVRWDPRTCTIGYAIIVIDDREHTADEWRAIAEHEVGHVLGLAHDFAPESVMAHPVRATARITEEDQALVRKRWSEENQ